MDKYSTSRKIDGKEFLEHRVGVRRFSSNGGVLHAEAIRLRKAGFYVRNVTTPKGQRLFIRPKKLW